MAGYDLPLPKNGILNTHPEALKALQSVAFSPSPAIMSHAAQHRSDEKKSDETGASIKNDEQTPTSVHTVQVLLAGSVDPVYAAKAQALNDAIGSIGMGRYQVIPSVSAQASFHRLLCNAFIHPSVTISLCFLSGSLPVFHSGTCSLSLVLGILWITSILWSPG
jgi:hypothetical protein